MKIGIDARFYGSLGKGLGRYTEKLIEHLELLDQKNEYVVFLRRENFDEYIPKNPHFTKAVAQYAWYGFSEQLLFVVMLYRFSFDLVHFPHFNVPVLYRKAFVVTIHDLILVHYPTVRNTTRLALLYGMKFLVYRYVIASAIRRARYIITVSEFTKQDIVREYPGARGKVTVTYEAADSFCQYSRPADEKRLFERLSLRELSLMPDESKTVSHDILKKYFLYVGNAYPHKNLPVLFAAARAFPQYQLVLVGKDDFFYQKLQKQAKDEGLSNVLFTGFLTDHELSSLYRFAQCYIFPSLYEGFGLPPLEAMSRGTVVVASDRGSLPEILGEAAWYFNPTDEQSLVESLHLLESDVDKKNVLRGLGYRQAAGYSFHDMAIATLSIYQEVGTNTTHYAAVSSSKI